MEASPYDPFRKKSKKRSLKHVHRCTCKRSRCLKLYCDCFANCVFCTDSCECVDCINNKDNETLVNQCRRSISERNSKAFDQTISCSCKRTNCLKKYCDCYRIGILCTDKCSCVDCSNMLLSSESKESAKIYFSVFLEG